MAEIRKDPLAEDDEDPEEPLEEAAEPAAEEGMEDDYGDEEDKIFPGGDVGDDDDDVVPDDSHDVDGDYIVEDGEDRDLGDTQMAAIPDDAWDDAPEQERRAKEALENKIKRRRLERSVKSMFRKGLENLTEAMEVYNMCPVSDDNWKWYDSKMCKLSFHYSILFDKLKN